MTTKCIQYCGIGVTILLEHDQPYLIPIPKDLFMKAYRAFVNYKLYLEDEKRRKKAAEKEEKLKKQPFETDNTKKKKKPLYKPTNEDYRT